MGWASRRRDHGGLIFVDLRDREGLTQLVFNPALDPAAHEAAGRIRVEFVLAVEGTVERRPPGTVNAHLATGEIEVSVRRLRILNESKPLPFPLDESQETVESLRLKYRYLDLRRPAMLGHLLLRDQVCRATRDYLHGQGFVEVETPMLTRSTPEGARDFLVPSRLTPGTFYALPQSPQLFKQILMVGGLERYFQIVRCFRDEDLRADRQPEFTQIDIETAFLDRDDFLPIMEGLVAEIFRRAKGLELARPFRRLTWDEAIRRYGSDKPDLRFGLELSDCSELFRGGAFQVFAQAVAQGGAVQALTVPGAAFSRKDLDDLVERAKGAGAKGLVWVRVGEGTHPEPGRAPPGGGAGRPPRPDGREARRPRAAGRRPDAARRHGAGAAPRRARAPPRADRRRRRTSSCGSSTSRWSSGTRRSGAGTRCTIRSRRRRTRTPRRAWRTRAPRARRPTTSS